MCFYHDDYDWYAAIIEDEHVTIDKARRCGECGRSLPVEGETMRRVFQQEDEYCRNDPESSRYEGETEEGNCNEECEHDFGEEYEYWSCLECEKLLKAIQAAEEEAGCKGPETQPNLGELHDAMREEDAERYREKAMVMFPEIATHVASYYPERKEDE